MSDKKYIDALVDHVTQGANIVAEISAMEKRRDADNAWYERTLKRIIAKNDALVAELGKFKKGGAK